MKKNNRLIKCKNVMCGKEFTTRAGLRYHQRTSQNIDCQQAHSGAPLPLDFDAVVEKGEVLIFPKGKRGVPLLILVQTENQMTEEFKCLVRGCGKSYPTRGGLRYHLLGCHRISSPVAAKLDVLCGKKRRQSEKILESVHFENYSDEHEHEDHEEEEYNEHENHEEHEDSDEMEEEEHMAHQILMNAKNSYHNHHHHTLKSATQQTPMNINEIAPSISFNTKFDGKLPPLASLPSISKYLLVPSTGPLSFSSSSYKTCNLPDSPTSSSSSSCLHQSMLPNMKEMFQFNKPYEKQHQNQQQLQQQQQQKVITGNGIIHPKPIKYSLSSFNSTA